MRLVFTIVSLCTLASCVPAGFVAPAPSAPTPVVTGGTGFSASALVLSGQASSPGFIRRSPIADFDLLPEAHKKLVGFIFVTKSGNTAIRELSATGAGDYFDGAWTYSGGKLEPVDLSGAAEAPYRAAAKRFFGKISSYKLATHDVGATTRNFAVRKNFPDVYLTANAAPEVLVHEMGHVVDFRHSYTDFADPKWPWTRKGAMNAYGATHPGEDFAEAYRFYVLDGPAFRDVWAKESKEVSQKYAYLRKRAFGGVQYGTGGVFAELPVETAPRMR